LTEEPPAAKLAAGLCRKRQATTLYPNLQTGIIDGVIIVSGFYPEPNPDNALHYERTVPHELERQVLAAMDWAELRDVPPGETDLTQDQASVVITALGDVPRYDLVYSIGLFR
jgi:hypothetical protein